MITVYTIAYNEEVLMQFMVEHYRSRFPGCRIIVYNRRSTDNTVKIALANNCEVVSFDTNNLFNDRIHREIKNSCWKKALTDWVLVSDLDELLDINEEQLKIEENAGTTIIKPEGYNMVNMEDNFDIAGIKYGVRDASYDKCLLFNKKFISEINYVAGAHECDPQGRVIFNKNPYKLFHYKLINENYTTERAREKIAMLSPENLANGWVCETPEEVHEIYEGDRQEAIKLR